MRRVAITLLVAALSMHGSGTARSAQALSDPARRGAALYLGDMPLDARLPGHARALPAEAVRCANCHAPKPSPSAARDPQIITGQDAARRPAALRPTDDNIAPPLDAAGLLALRERRGGPPSRFDAASLCTLLRTGVDPAHVVVRQPMPRYTIDDATCRDLWAYLYERTSN